jgi:hypothetical protein
MRVMPSEAMFAVQQAAETIENGRDKLAANEEHADK